MNFIDYYTVLGVTEQATSAEIKKAYRRLARKYHPDVSKEDDAEAKFKEVGEAYAVLGDEEKKAQYDEMRSYRGGSDENFIPPDWQHREGDAGFYHTETDGFSDFFETIFRREAAQGRQSPGNFRGADIRYILPITLEEAFAGGERTIKYGTTVYNERGQQVLRETSLRVTLPKGLLPGQQLRLAAKGQPGVGSGAAGDLLLEIEYLAHDRFTIQGNDLLYFLPVAPWELALGAVIEVPTLTGLVKLSVPENSQPGQKLRVKGKGLPAKPPGDLYVVLQVRFPRVANESQKQAFEALRGQFTFDPRNEVSA